MLILPKTIKIGSFVYKILFPCDNIEPEGMVGLHEYHSATIKLSKVDGSSTRTDQKIVQTLLHEILHGIDAIYCGTILEESTIGMLASAWFQILIDNDFKFDIDNIPKKVKVCGITYTVISPYTFTELGTTAGIDNPNATIRLSVGINGTKFCTEFVFVNLIGSIISAILSSYSIDMEDREGIGDTKVINTLANGLYQIFTESNLIEIIKKVRC